MNEIESLPPKPKSSLFMKILIVLILIGLGALGWVLFQKYQRDKLANRPLGLEPLAFEPLPLGQIKPKGWLLDQLKLQAGGLSGHLDEFWPDVKDSGWIGGGAEGWERAPYWLDGVVPLAYLTDDPKLKTKVHRWMDYILEHPLSDGWLGPEKSPGPTLRDGLKAPSPDPKDPWPQFIILKVLSQYADATGDARVVPAMRRDLEALSAQLDIRPLFAWNYFRYGDLLLSLYWLYDRTKDPWYLQLAYKAANQGYNWPKHFTDLPIKEKSPGWNWAGHVVNNAMGLKTPGMLYRLTGDEKFKKAAYGALPELDKYHGEANGLFSGDECLAGKSPSQGTELCAIVETMFSLENQLALLGDVQFADRLEKIAFNALPAACTGDYWGHQYDEQSNQVACVYVDVPVYSTNRGEANLFGLEPQYGCCTSNFHQGWPKFVSHLWMATPDQGLAAVAYAPSSVETQIAGVPVSIELATDYPFSDKLEFKVRVPQPVDFPLYLRVPVWADNARLILPDGSEKSLSSGKFYKVSRKWNGVESLTLILPMKFKVRRGYQDSVSVERGPLVYSLRIQEQWERSLPFGNQPKGMRKWDYMVLPQSPWNYALQLDTDSPEKTLELKSKPLQGNPFTLDGTPLMVSAKGRRLMDWSFAQGTAQPPPQSPVQSSEPLQELFLVPYGSARLRVTEFPLLK